MRNLALTTLLILALVPLHAVSETAESGEFVPNCPAPELLPKIDKAYHECKRRDPNGESCKDFLHFYRKLLPTYDCSFPEGHLQVPAIWLAGAAHEDYVELLSRLKNSEAQKLFTSEEFRATLDGALAEEYGPISMQVEKQLHRKKRPTPNPTVKRDAP